MQVAAELGSGLHRYWKIENGHTAPDQKEREKLAKIFRVAESDIFGAVAA
jgi:transcriptional regulator with XRE-family HTH domain